MTITQEELKRLLCYDGNSGEFVWLVQRSRWTVGQRAGKTSRFGYRRIGIGRRHYPAHRLAWLYVYGEWPAGDLDHINRDRADNRIGNLRLATPSENGGNRSLNRKSVSGVKGVVWNKDSKKWQAQIAKNGRLHYLGLHSTVAEAAEAYAKAAADLFGEFAHIPCNEPQRTAPVNTTETTEQQK